MNIIAKKITVILLFVTVGVLQAQVLEPTEKQALVNVVVVDRQEKPLEGEIVLFTSVKNKKVYKNHTDSEGKISILLPIGDSYEVKYRNLTKEENYSKIDIPKEEGLYTWNLKITFGTFVKTVVLENVEYDFNKATLRPSSYKTLDDLVEVMAIKDKMKIEIGGHTDNKGSEEYNLKLSQDRAESVRNYLIAKGIKGNRIVAKGYGASEPVAFNENPDGSDNPDGRQRNRRTVVKIIEGQE